MIPLFFTGIILVKKKKNKKQNIRAQSKKNRQNKYDFIAKI